MSNPSGSGKYEVVPGDFEGLAAVWRSLAEEVDKACRLGKGAGDIEIPSFDPISTQLRDALAEMAHNGPGSSTHALAEAVRLMNHQADVVAGMGRRYRRDDEEGAAAIEGGGAR